MAKFQKHSVCPTCDKTHEECADAESCESWKTSYEICIIFGTRPAKPEFNISGAFK